MDERRNKEREDSPSHDMVNCLKRKGRTEREIAYGNALIRISQGQFEVLYLADVERKSDQNIAIELDVPLATIRQWKNAARKSVYIGALAELGHNRATRGEGFTISPITALHPAYPAGYVVSLDGFEQCVEGVPSVALIEVWLTRHWDALITPPLLPTPALLCPWFGGWAEGSAFVLDISVILQDKAAAIRLAKDQKQIAMWDLANQESIFV